METAVGAISGFGGAWRHEKAPSCTRQNGAYYGINSLSVMQSRKRSISQGVVRLVFLSYLPTSVRLMA
jgi:hypothetical protein